MATNDGATTELFTGWSSVVHQPEDDPEESELPSTVDIGALSAEPPDPNQTHNEADSDSDSEDSEADSSNSEGSDDESCSPSDSSDSDSSTSTQESSSRSHSPSPEFSVTSSQTNGLRLTIATVRKSTSSPTTTSKKTTLESGTIKSLTNKLKKRKKSTSSSSSECSTDSDSDSDSKSDSKESKIEPKAPPAVQKVNQSAVGCSKKVIPNMAKLKISSNSTTPSSNNKSAKNPESTCTNKEKEKSGSALNRSTIVRDSHSSKENILTTKLRSSSASGALGTSSKTDKEENSQVVPKVRVNSNASTTRNSESESSLKKEQDKDMSALTKLKAPSSSTITSSSTGKEKESRTREPINTMILKAKGANTRNVKTKTRESPVTLKLRSSITNLATSKDRETKEAPNREREKSSPLSIKIPSSCSSVCNNSSTNNEKDNTDISRATVANVVKDMGKEKLDNKKSSPAVPKAKLLSGGNDGNFGKDKEKEGCSDVNKEKDKDIAGNEKGNKADGKNGKKKMRTKRRSKKMASVPLSRSSTYSTSDSESSDDLLPASCSLQEIRQEDLAAILPDQNECNDFNDFDKDDKGYPATGDMSGSDMELPQQAIKSLIERTTESSSDGEGHQLPNPQSLFANSLLQQFVANNPLLSPPSAHSLNNSSLNDTLTPSKSLNISVDSCQNASLNVNSKDSNDSCQTAKTDVSSGEKRRRGRPKKVRSVERRGDVVDEGVKGLDGGGGSKHVPDFCGGPNVSPDSGIQNSPDHVSSPEPSLSPNVRSKPSQTKEEPKKIPTETSSSDSKSQPKALKSSQPSRNTSQEKVKESVNKMSVTSNQFDRVLYANSDRVLYPPKRKAGRPPARRPGRPPKHKTVEAVDSRTSEKPVHSIKSRGRSKTVLSSTNMKPLTTKKSITLKVPKIFHSKHKHKHKKRKFKILKPLVSCDPKINQEIEKLIADFVRLCVIATKQPKDNVTEQVLKTLKKVTKKRRTTDHMEKKKKKQSISTTVNKVHNSNEQRLPLKKRHYHLVSNNNENQKAESEKEESKDKVPEKVEEKEVKSEVKSKTEKKDKVKENRVTPKYTPVIKNHINNNEYEVKSEKTEKDPVPQTEETTPPQKSKTVDKEKKQPSKEVKTPDDKVVTATTPKKRHRLENLHTESETTPSSVSTTPEIKTEEPSETFEEKLEKLKPKITVESYINELKIKRNNLLAQKNIEECNKVAEDSASAKIQKGTPVPQQVEKTIPVSPESTKKKVRKRRAINRTGFPTVKKKKKKPSLEPPPEQPPEEEENKTLPSVCERVPKEGEEYTEFLQRTNDDSVKDLTTVEKVIEKPLSDDFMSECESLPQDERTDFDFDDTSSRSDSIAESLPELRRRKKGTDDGNESMSLLESSIERLKSRLDQKKRKRSKDLKNIIAETNTYPKRRRREDSPASSIEPSVESRLLDSNSTSGDESYRKNKKTPKWRKKYLAAGLFSDYYKEDESKRQEISKLSRNLVYNPEEHPYGLLPPPYHCGKYLRCRKVDFQLPFDIWWQHTHQLLPGRESVPSWNYRKIRTNVYNVKNNGGACEPQACNCKPSSNCGDDCINRLVLAECPAVHKCNNQRIQKHDWAPGIEKFMTEDKGWGVRTKEPIKQGEFILEYVGEVVSDQEFKERMHSIYANDTHHYCLHLDGGLVIDGHRMGGDGRFVNHSCQPNCEMQKWSVNGQFRMALFALRDIEPYEEITYDYNFSLFNPAEGQECKCGSNHCRGVIGGKTQRIRQLPDQPAAPRNPGRVGRPRKTEAKKKPNATKESVPNNPPPIQPVVPQIQVKPMSHQQKCFILEHHCFLLRNLTKVRKVRDRSQSITSTTTPRQQTATPSDTSAFMNQLNALQKPRNIKTRRVAQAEDDPELNKTVKLAAILKEILVAITSVKDDKNKLLSSNLMLLPSKRKVPEFYQKVSDPIDLTTIEQNIATGIYKTPQAFDEDMARLFAGFAKFYDLTTDIGIATTKLKKIYSETKKKSLPKFENILGEKPKIFINNRRKNEEEDIIRCICGIPRDEGLMIQCERCMVWQHIECVKADASVASYHCEICIPRQVDYEIPMDEFTEHGHRYYMTLMRGTLQLRQGDTVYVLRDIPIAGTDKKHTYDTIGKIDYSELDIFRIERLWKDKDTGKRLAYGHHYLRPHETFHEPTRKFFPNEVMRVPLYEAVPVELVMEHCWVMDLNTYCKGRPMGAKEEHVYICEYRVDKGAKMFSKVSKSKFPICTKTFAFERFETRLKISRTYCPHDVDEAFIKSHAGRKRTDQQDKPVSTKDGTQNNASVQPPLSLPPIQRTPAQQKTRLNKILLNLLSKMPTKQVLDVSYLLEGGRRRKKQDTKQ